MPGTFSPPPRFSDPDMHHGTCVTHVPWCMPRSLISGFLWSRWRGKRSRPSQRMRNPQFCVSGKRPLDKIVFESVALIRNYRLIHMGVLTQPAAHFKRLQVILISSRLSCWCCCWKILYRFRLLCAGHVVACSVTDWLAIYGTVSFMAKCSIEALGFGEVFVLVKLLFASPGVRLLTWFHFNPGMDRHLYAH